MLPKILFKKIYAVTEKYIRILALHSEFSKGPKYPTLLINSWCKFIWFQIYRAQSCDKLLALSGLMSKKGKENQLSRVIQPNFIEKIVGKNR